jgi:hypothetical protein
MREEVEHVGNRLALQHTYGIPNGRTNVSPPITQRVHGKSEEERVQEREKERDRSRKEEEERVSARQQKSANTHSIMCSKNTT